MILNQDETWGNLKEKLKNSFKDEGERKLLNKGMKIYKFNDTNELSEGPDGSVSEFWSPYHPYEWDGGLENRIKVGEKMGKATLKELSRIVVAVREDWSSLDYLVTAELNRAVYCFFGAVAWQERYKPFDKADENVEFRRNLRSDDERQGIGGGKQIWGGKLVGTASQLVIPNLTKAHLSNISSKPLTELQQ